MNSSIALETYELPELSELAVNITNVLDPAAVLAQLQAAWTWVGFTIGVLTDEDNVSTEWLILAGAQAK
jgi:hypothetical protein